MYDTFEGNKRLYTDKMNSMNNRRNHLMFYIRFIPEPKYFNHD